MEHEHYVYVYLNPLKSGRFIYGKFSFDYEPFYIGKGKNNRLNKHINYIDSSKESLKSNIIKKIIRLGSNPIIIKLYENVSDYSSIRLERYLIKLIGRKNLKLGPLSNLTDGGEGSSGILVKKSTIYKRKKSIEARGGVWNKGLRGYQVSSNKGKNLSNSTKDKISKKLTGIKQSNETINKRRNTNKERYNGAWNKGLKTGVPAHNIKAVIKLDLDNNPIEEYKSVKEARDNNPTAMTIIKVCNGKNNKSGGFKWKWK
jgi:hypothetical protein